MQEIGKVGKIRDGQWGSGWEEGDRKNGNGGEKYAERSVEEEGRWSSLLAAAVAAACGGGDGGGG